MLLPDAWYPKRQNVSTFRGINFRFGPKPVQINFRARRWWFALPPTTLAQAMIDHSDLDVDHTPTQARMERDAKRKELCRGL